MNLVGYTATALSRNDIIDTPTNKNVVDFAIVELKDLQGNLVVMYDDAEGLNPETQKTCDTNGQVTFFAEIGDYDLEINGKAQRINLAANIADYIKLGTGESVQEFADSFALKIFQSPTDGGLTEIQTRTVNASEVYEVRKTSDGSLATIYSDAAGTTEIVQNGTANKSGSDGVVEFFVADGSYYITVGIMRSDFRVTYSARPLTPYDFGAVGGGVADDTAAWSAFVAGEGELIPADSYLVNGIVKTYLMPTFVRTQLNNHASGFSAFESNTTGYSNVAVGYRALQKNDEGFDNLAIGVQAMKDNTTGNRNTAVGTDALAKNTTGDHNLALGQNALGYNTTGTYNTALGIDALEYGEDNNFNTAIGQYAGLNLASSKNNTVIGYNTYQAAKSGNGNVSLGFDTLRDQDGVDGNTAIGTEAARGNTSGTYITAVGYRAARTNTIGTHITAIGDQAAFKNLDGTHNMAMGFSAGYNNVSGDWNTAIGDHALYLNTDSNNTAIGGYAGYNITTGNQNTFIGYGAGFSGSQKVDAVNTTAVGRGAFTTDDNTVQLGNPAVVGVGVGLNNMYWLAALPTTGVWARGSVIWNLSVVAGGSMGWMCVTGGDFAGTPPTFKAMPNLAA